MNKNEILMNLFQALIDKDFRKGFEDSAAHRAWNELSRNGFKGLEFWNDFCNVDKHSQKLPKLVQKYGQELVDKYLEIQEIENNGRKHELPAWAHSRT